MAFWIGACWRGSGRQTSDERIDTLGVETVSLLIGGGQRRLLDMVRARYIIRTCQDAKRCAMSMKKSDPLYQSHEQKVEERLLSIDLELERIGRRSYETTSILFLILAANILLAFMLWRIW